ncbi:SEC14-like protein 2 [Orchesella cincta]|uniref:SEC14-like protein 2 n=1 Tax=Orchesella cincta TaxID=48709 RepID=A0A1D2MMT0_ORCCI|nr:SEC14-like protein 2 [Orchesella cincta]
MTNDIMTVSNSYASEAYSQVEQQHLKEFRTKVSDLELSDEQQDDAFLIRWLRARNLDIEKAYDMLNKSLEWRKEHKVDGILEREDVPEDIKKKTPFAHCGLDKEGYPILLLPVGRQDGRTLLESHGFDTCFRYNTINCEKVMKMLKDLSEQQGRKVTQIVEIIDLDGYSYRQLTSKACRDFMVKMQTTVDIMIQSMVINAPKIFHILFSVLKPFIPKQTLEKVDIYGPEPEKWKKVIKERFPLESIPPHWGGTRQGSDAFCSQSEIWLQGPVPISFFKDGTASEDGDNETSMTQATINSRDTLKVDLVVNKPDSSIAWRFHSQSHDIGFQIVFENDQVVLPFRRVQSQKETQEGTHPCHALGTYTVIFDNSYSLARSKVISYNLSVIEPEDVNSNVTNVVVE